MKNLLLTLMLMSLLVPCTMGNFDHLRNMIIKECLQSINCKSRWTCPEKLCKAGDTRNRIVNSCTQSIKCKSVGYCPDVLCKAGDRQRKALALEKKKLKPYSSKADLLADFNRYRTNQESIVKKQESIAKKQESTVKQMKRQMKELTRIEKGAEELTKQ